MFVAEVINTRRFRITVEYWSEYYCYWQNASLSCTCLGWITTKEFGKKKLQFNILILEPLRRGLDHDCGR